MRKDLEPTFTLLDDAGRLMIAAGRALERRGAERFLPYGLTVSDVAPLMRLTQLGPMTPTSLLEAELLLSSSPVVSHSLRRLEAAGLVIRRPHETDGRKVVIEVTEAGRDTADRLHREIQDLQEEFFAPIPESELATLRDILLRCLEGPGAAAPPT